MRSWLVMSALLVIFSSASSLRAEDKTVPEGFTPLFNGKDLEGWKVFDGKMNVWKAEKGLLVVKGHGGGWLMTEKEYGDFEIRLEYKMSVHGNSGVGLRAPLEGNPAYQGMEIQLLDDKAWEKDNIRPAQYTGAIYDVVPPSQHVTKPAGKWNKIRIVAKGRTIIVELNGTEIVNANLDEHKDHYGKHPGLQRTTGHLGLQSHNDRVEFRNLYIKPL